MKKLLVLSLILLLPVIVLAQKRQKYTTIVTVKEFFDKYSEYPGYECLEINEQMFKQFLKTDGLDQEMINFLSSLRYIRYLEHKQSQRISVASHEAGASSISRKRGGNIVYVDGVRIRGTQYIPIAARDSIKVGDRNLSTKGKIAGRSTFAVASSVAGVSSSRSNILYTRAKNEINLTFFTQLMKSTKEGEKLLFMKRDAGRGYTEYILLTGNTMINIMGDININHINQIEEILEAVGDILP
ncbi:MAG: DUF4252 domain-containing protein [Bacteroidales bacterium]|nr:DUF4252 domain-containing protein [Bacteroidales bacterium]